MHVDRLSSLKKYQGPEDYREKMALRGKNQAPAKNLEGMNEGKAPAAKPEAPVKPPGQETPSEGKAPLETASPPPTPPSSSVTISDEAKQLAKNLLGPSPDLTAAPPEEATPKPQTKAAQISEKAFKEKWIDRPALFFIKGHAFEGSGIERISDNLPGAEEFSYGEHDKVVEQILKRPAGRPIALVGHGLGGDTAVEVAQQLNRPEHGFRKVDLLVTMDALGFDNDIIPQNVVKNVNYIGNQETFWGLLNDSPKIAKDSTMTEVVNELRPEGHNAVADATDVQFKIFQHIKNLKNLEA